MSEVINTELYAMKSNDILTKNVSTAQIDQVLSCKQVRLAL